jgi:hypothetical protein
VSRIPIPDHLIHKPEEVEENARLFDVLVSLIEFGDDESRQIIASTLLEKIRQRVLIEGEIKLPFGLIIKPTKTVAD